MCDLCLYPNHLNWMPSTIEHHLALKNRKIFFLGKEGYELWGKWMRNLLTCKEYHSWGKWMRSEGEQDMIQLERWKSMQTWGLDSSYSTSHLYTQQTSRQTQKKMHIWWLFALNAEHSSSFNLNVVMWQVFALNNICIAKLELQFASDFLRKCLWGEISPHFNKVISFWAVLQVLKQFRQIRLKLVTN